VSIKLFFLLKYLTAKFYFIWIFSRNCPSCTWYQQNIMLACKFQMMTRITHVSSLIW